MQDVRRTDRKINIVFHMKKYLIIIVIFIIGCASNESANFSGAAKEQKAEWINSVLFKLGELKSDKGEITVVMMAVPPIKDIDDLLNNLKKKCGGSNLRGNNYAIVSSEHYFNKEPYRSALANFYSRNDASWVKYNSEIRELHSKLVANYNFKQRALYYKNKRVNKKEILNRQVVCAY